MKRILSVLLAASTAFAMVPAAQAESSYIIQGNSIKRTCYVAVAMPAEIKVTRDGQLVQRGAPVVIGSYAAGNLVEFTRTPDVYIETRKVVSPEFTSLVPTPCP